MPKGPKGRPPKGTPIGIDALLSRPKRKRLNNLERRELKAAAVHDYLRKVGRKAQKGKEPNDRSFNADTGREIRQMKPDIFYSLIHNGEEDDS
jgi:hypothetical protein